MNCKICDKPISGRYYIDSWDNKVCAIHIDSKEVVGCSVCTGFTENINSLVDGRVLCPICMNSVVKTSDDLEQLISFVVKNLKRAGFIDLQTNNIKVEIVSAVYMAKVRGGQVSTNNKGLVLSKVQNSFSLLGGSKEVMQHTIYMLDYQAKAEFAGTLAHELLHAWQVQNHISPHPKQCEGLCNLASYYIIKIMPTSLSSVLIKNMENNPDPIYGDGFREVFTLYEDTDWGGVIEYYKQKKFI